MVSFLQSFHRMLKRLHPERRLVSHNTTKYPLLSFSISTIIPALFLMYSKLHCLPGHSLPNLVGYFTKHVCFVGFLFLLGF